MRLISWNCKMAFRNKAPAIMRLCPDVLVIPECECPEKLQQSTIHEATLFSDALLKLDDEHCVWVGKNPDKGLGVFAFGTYSLQRLPYDLAKGPIWCAPVHVRRDGLEAFDLIAVWSFYGADSRNRNQNPMVHALEDFAPLFISMHLVVAGDFNSPINFEEKGPGGFQTTNRELEGRGLVNAYNTATGELLGQESQPTYYHWHGKMHTHHIDHVYVPKSWASGMTVTCGDYDTWVTRQRSDHVPVIVDIREPLGASEPVINCSAPSKSWRQNESIE